jgi:selenocysteine-specific elongation factor
MASHPQLVLGTAGHVDHGKTTLVYALTGIDTDRLTEEKRRGITIDLGFAHGSFDDVAVAFVDVPGHEKFVHNMLAGVAGLDAVLLIVAADEGVMPQTHEHLHICELLGVPQGLLVLTRIDKLEDPDLLELCAEEVRELVQGTFLAEAPLLPASAVTGAGLSALKHALTHLTQSLPARHDERPFRLTIDRSFAVRGFGTVVTGTVHSGALALEQEVMQFPAGKLWRVRGLQQHGAKVPQVTHGARAAINLAQVGAEEIGRGDQLAAAGSLLTSYLLNVELQVLADVSRPLRRREVVQVHLGSASVVGRLIPLEHEPLEPNATSLVQLRLEQPVSTRCGDRFLIRGLQPVSTLGGGVVLDPAPHKSRRLRHDLASRLRRVRDDSASEQLLAALWLQSTRGATLQELTLRTTSSLKALHKEMQALQSQQQVVQIDVATKHLLHHEHVRRVGRFVQRVLRQHHLQFPEREGMLPAELSGKLRPLFPHEEAISSVLRFLEKQGVCVKRAGHLALPEHQAQTQVDTEALLDQLVAAVRGGGFQPLRQTLLLEQLRLPEKQGVELLKQATFRKVLVRVAEDLWYTPEQIASFREQLQRWFAAHETISVIECKNLLETGRRHALELLEHADQQHWTRRVDNHRIQASQLSP